MKPSASNSGPILVASDFSAAADEAIRQAHAWAKHAERQLVALHVMAGGVTVHPLFPQLYQRDAMEVVTVERDLAQQLSDTIQRCTGMALDPARVHVDFGEPYAAIVRKAEQLGASLVVVGGAGATGLKRMLLGSVAERVLHNAHCSVLVSRPAKGGGSVLAATDLSDPALPAVRAAALEARRRELPLTVMHNIDLWPSLVSGMALLGPVPLAPDADTVAEQKADLLAIMQSQLERLELKGNLAVTIESNTAAAIVRQADAEQADLLVLGSRGRTGLARLALGSVVKEVVRHAHCSVLVIRMDENGSRTTP